MCLPKIVKSRPFVMLGRYLEISEWKGAEGGVIWSHLPVRAESFQDTFHRTASREILSISSEGDTTPFLGNCSSAQSPTVLRSSLSNPRCNFCASVSAHVLLSYHSAALKRAWLHLLDSLPSDMHSQSGWCHPACWHIRSTTA